MICTIEPRPSHGTKELKFELKNDPRSIPVIIQQVLDDLSMRNWGNDLVQMRISLALHEGLSNAIYHGNLEVSSKIVSESTEPFYQLAEQRRRVDPYANRKIQFHAIHETDKVRYYIEDQGPGFDFSLLPDPTAEENVGLFNGRGLFLIRNVMDEVNFFEPGNLIQMVMYNPPPNPELDAFSQTMPGLVA